MRVTNRLLLDNFMRDITLNRNEYADISSRLSSGKEVRYASDDPVNFQRSRFLEENLRKVNQFQSNIDSGLRQARFAQEALDAAIDDLIKVKSVLVQGASDNYDEGDRENMADQVAGLRDSLVSLFNTKSGDRYLFAGTNSAVPPFEEDPLNPGAILNNSNSSDPKVAVDDGVLVNVSINGQELVATDSGDLFTILGDIEQALRDNDSTILNSLMDAADDMVDQVTDSASKIGSNINRMEFQFEQYEFTKITLESDISSLTDADYAEAAADLSSNQIAYDSAIAVYQSMFSNTLLNYL
ncbi:MAG: flagellar hook-associated protein FlgL [Balneolales bacterium]|nr:flagellar hook-associated protein FlgL [Balneolales bacterium]